MTEIYLPDNLFKNILSYCGDPLPSDQYFYSYNCRVTRKYYRDKNGKIEYKHVQTVIKCRRCKTDYKDTGYLYCSDCYDFFKKDIQVKKGICLLDSDEES